LCLVCWSSKAQTSRATCKVTCLCLVRWPSKAQTSRATCNIHTMILISCRCCLLTFYASACYRAPVVGDIIGAFRRGKGRPPPLDTIKAISFIASSQFDYRSNKKYILWNVHLPNVLHSVCLNRLSSTEVGIYNGANSPNGFLTAAVA